MRVVAIILAGGSGERFGEDKALMALGDRPLWRWSFDAYRCHPGIAAVGLVGSDSNLATLKEGGDNAAFVVAGGSDRQASALAGCMAAEGKADAVLLHDAARPFVTKALIDRAIEAIERVGAAAAAVPVVDTIREVNGNTTVLLDRTTVRAMQTPQGGRLDWLIEAQRTATGRYTDEMALLESAGRRVEMIEGDPENFKVTTRSDYVRACARVASTETRVGIGYDIHSFSTDPEKPLLLGGLKFEGAPGLDGHSDADVLLHAVVDGILGAAALGDIGQHFPNTDAQWRGERSSTFICYAANLVRSEGWRVASIDATVVAEKPKIMPRALEIRRSIADILKIDPELVSVKATTNEGLGMIGQGEGIAAFAVATLSRS